MSEPMLLILGCTAGGKSKLAFELAQRLDGQILSVDSMKVYRRMDIGTAKPPESVRQTIKHHLIDVVEPSEPFSLGRFIDLADATIARMQQQRRPIIAVGGTGMYLRGLLEGIFQGPTANSELREKLKKQAQQHGSAKLHKQLTEVDAASAQRIHPNDLKRIVRALEVYELTGEPISSLQQQFRTGRYRYNWQIIGLRRDKQDASSRTNQRIKLMIEAGLVDEVTALLAEPAGLSKQAAQAVGYVEIIEYLQGKSTLDDAIEQIKINTRRFAKKQRTWFRSFTDVNWLDVASDESTESLADRITTILKLS